MQLSGLLLILLLGVSCITCNMMKQNMMLKKKLTKFSATFLPGACSNNFLNKTNPGLYSTNLIGQDTPVGVFLTYQAAHDYLYGVACEIDGFGPRPNTLIRATFKNLMYHPHKLITRAMVTFELTGGKKLTAFTDMAWDSTYKICGFDFNNRNTGKTFDPAATDKTKTISDLCNSIQATCTGANQQFTSVTDCTNFMTNIQFGSYDRGDQNNVLCRSEHAYIAPSRPAYYCVQMGKTGGEKCIDRKFQDFYNFPDFLGCAAMRI